jgi:hypothetical protein
MEAVIGSLFCFILDGSERVHSRSHRGGKMRFKSMFDVWLLSSKKERLEAIQSDYKLHYFGESQVIQCDASLLLFLRLCYYRLPNLESGVCCEMQRRKTA